MNNLISGGPVVPPGVPYVVPKPAFVPEREPFWYYDWENQSLEVAYACPLWDPWHNYKFAGWYFHDRGLIQPLPIETSYGEMYLPSRCGVLQFDAFLHNPEAPNLYLSYHTYGESWCHWTRERAAAWLIAHWYEHYMHICPCILDDHKKSNFRKACIDTFIRLEVDP